MADISRRNFLQRGAAAAAAFTIAPSNILGKSHGYQAPSDKLNIAGVGIGSMGAGNLRTLAGLYRARRGETPPSPLPAPTGENIVALCDVDWSTQFQKALDTAKEYPNAKRYSDWRKMYDEMGKDIDAVLVATSDHCHATIAANAITLGKHVYVQKPLTHSVYESRLLTKLAAKYNVATQMGNQGSSGEGVDLITEWIQNGEIGEVKRVDCATDRPVWPQGLDIPKRVDRIPKGLDWDLFTGPAKMFPFSIAYHPWNWRGWWPYGTGALGDMACHIMHCAFHAMNLMYPITAEASSSLLLSHCAPVSQHVKLVYPARDNMPKVALPQVEIHWYDGGIMPDRPEGFPQNRALMGSGGGLNIFHGTKDKILCGCYAGGPWLLSGRVPNAPKTERRVGMSHELDWVRACKERPANRVKTKADFSVAGPFNEMVVMGVLAVRLQELNKILEWDGANMKFTNIGADEKISMVITDGANIDEGHPLRSPKRTEPENALAFANELIKHTYRNGWDLPAMP